MRTEAAPSSGASTASSPPVPRRSRSISRARLSPAKVKLDQLTAALATLQLAGASAAVLEQMEREVEEQRRIAAIDQRPLAVRLAAAKTMAEQAASKKEAADATLKAAKEAAEEAEKEDAKCTETLAELEREEAAAAAAASAADVAAALAAAATATLQAPGEVTLAALQSALQAYAAVGLGAPTDEEAEEREHGDDDETMGMGRGGVPAVSGRHGTSPARSVSRPREAEAGAAEAAGKKPRLAGDAN